MIISENNILTIRGVRMKKGSLELSINAIVIIVLAMTILGLGLGFVRSQFKQIGSTGLQVQEQIKEQILEQMRTSGKKLAIQKQVNLERRESTVLGIGVMNVGDGPVTLSMDIEFKEKKGAGPGEGEGDIDFFYDSDEFTLTSTEEKVFSAEVTAGSASGTYLYTVTFYEGNEVYGKQSFFVKVQ